MADRFELGLDTFGDVTVGAGRHAASRRPACCATSSKRRSWPIDLGLDAFGVGEHHRPDFAISAPEVMLAAIAGRTRADPARIGGDGAEHGRSRARVPAVLDAQRGVERARRSDPRPRIVHRVVSALRLRPVALRGALRGQALAVRRAAQGRPGDVERLDAFGDHRRDDPPADRERHAQDLGWRRRKPGIGRARGALRPAADARDHRRQSGALPAVRRSLSSGAREARPAGAAVAVHSPGHVAADRRAGAGTSCGRTTRR